MSGKQIVVRIDGTHDGIIKSFDAAEAAAKKYAAQNGVAAKDLDKVTKDLEQGIKSFLKTAGDGFKRYGRELREMGKEEKAMAAAMEEYHRQNEMAGKKSADAILEHYREIHPEMAAAMEKARNEVRELEKAAKEAKFFEEYEKRVKDLVGEMKGMSGVLGQVGAKFEEELKRPLDDSVDRAKQIASELTRLHPEKAEQFAKIVRGIREDARKSEMDKLLGQLRVGSEKGRELADMLGERMKQSAAVGEGSVNQLIDRIAQIDPTIRQVTNQFQRTWDIAAQKAKESLGQPLEALRQAGPEGKQAAKQIVDEFRRAGKLSQSAMDKIFAPLDTTNARVGQATAEIRRHMKKVEESTEKMSQSVGKSAAMHITRAATAYLGMQEAVQAVTAAIQDQVRVLEEARQGHITMGEAQSQAYKNLTTLSAEQRKFLLEDFVLNTASEFNFNNEGISSLVKAVGDARSSGGSFKQIQEAVRVSAELNTLDQQNVDETAAALVQAMQATGISNAKLLASQMMVGQETSQVIDSTKFFRNVPAAMISASRSAAPGMERQSAIEAMAVFSALSRSGGDVMGESSQTATIQLNAKLGEYFKENASMAKEAREELRRIAAERGDLSGLSGAERRKAQSKLDAREKAARETLATSGSRVDPGTFMGRLKYIRENKLFDDLIDTVGKFGEQRFREGMEELMTSGKTLYDAYDSLQKLMASGGSTKVFEQTVKDFADGMTSQMQVSMTNMQTEAQEAQQSLSDSMGAMRQQNRETIQRAIDDSRRFMSDYISDFFNGVNGDSILWSARNGNGLAGEGTLAEGVSGLDILRQRRALNLKSAMKDGEIDTNEQAKLDRLDGAISTIMERTFRAPGIANKTTIADTEEAFKLATNQANRRIKHFAEGGYTEGEKKSIEFWIEMRDLLKDIRDEQEKNRLASEAIASASEETAANTSGGRQSNPADAQRTANGLR